MTMAISVEAPFHVEFQHANNASKPYLCITQLWISRRHNPCLRVRYLYHSAKATVSSNVATKPAEQKGKPSQNLQNNDVQTLCKEGRLKEAIDAMDQVGIWVDPDTYASVVQTCSHVKALVQGKRVHAQILQSGIKGNALLDTKLLVMYAKCGSLVDARLIFDRMVERNVFSWTHIIAAYARHGNGEEALRLFYQMQEEGTKSDNFIFPSVLKACAGLVALKQGKEIHSCIIKSGFESDFFVGSALVAMYTKCRCIESARQVFDKMAQKNEVSWNAMIAGYTQNGRDNEALKLFGEMQLEGMRPDAFTFGSALAVCANLMAPKQGREIHGYIIGSRFDLDVIVESALVDMYAKCRRIEDARRVFDKMSQRDVVSWNAMIAGYVQNGQSDEALKLLRQMQSEGMEPDLYTVSSIIPSCARITALRRGKEIHNFIVRRGLDSNDLVRNSLIDMYAKCGCLADARQVFDKMSQRDVVSWNAMITGYGMHGHGKEAVTLFYQMQQTGLKPDHITFIGVLSACSHAGLVDEGWQFFYHMTQHYQITPNVEHYACMVDLLGRAGLLKEAQVFISKMEIEPDACVWGALLGACRIHCNIEVGERVADSLFELEPENAGNYVLLSNIYATAGRWDDVAKVRNLMKERGLKKFPGCSWIEVKNRVHSFRVGGGSHPQIEKIHEMLDSLATQMAKEGYAPDVSFVLHDVEDKEKEHALLDHSEKLALAFGLINTCQGTPIRIIKNLRVCGDCHTAMKFISKMVNREIFVRDANRFHHFKDGVCSCRDYW